MCLSLGQPLDKQSLDAQLKQFELEQLKQFELKQLRQPNQPNQPKQPKQPKRRKVEEQSDLIGLSLEQQNGLKALAGANVIELHRFLKPTQRHQ